MASLNVYLADALKAEMETYEGVNWSQIAQEAIRAEIGRRKVMTELHADISSVVSRLKATPTSYDSGFEAGVNWAKADANACELEELDSWDWLADLEQMQLRNNEADSPDVARQLIEQEWGYSSASSLMGGRITERRLEGFVAGARSVWKQAKQLM